MDFKNGVVSVMSCSEAVSIKSCFSRDSTRIAKTYVLTLQRYEVYLKVPNILGLFIVRRFSGLVFLKRY